MDKFSVRLLFALFLSYSHFAAPIKINHRMIAAIDGTPRCESGKMLKLEKGLRSLLGKTPNEKLITHRNQKFTLEQLIAQETKAREQGRLPAFRNNHAGALDDAIRQFATITQPYLTEAQGFRDQMVILIEFWINEKGFKNSPLADWSTQPEGDELAQMKKKTTSFQRLGTLVNHLNMFLVDLRTSCEKSWRQFRKDNDL